MKQLWTQVTLSAIKTGYGHLATNPETEKTIKTKSKVKLSLCFTKHNGMKMYGGVKV